MPAIDQRRPSAHRANTGGKLRAHSRTSSATKLHGMTGFTAMNTATREHSKEKRKASPPKVQKNTPVEEDDDESAWVSSESGAATPNRDAATPEPTPTPPALVMKSKDKGKAPAQEPVQEPPVLHHEPSMTPPATRQPLPPLEPFIRTPSPTDTAKLHSSKSTRPPSTTSRRSPQPHAHHPHPHHLHKPHPLIRSTSHTAPLASPSYLTAQQTASSTPLSESPPPESPATSSIRKASFSSINLPAPQIRERTLSSMSTASASLAAIPRFNSMISAVGVPPPQQYVSMPVSKFFNPGEEEDSHRLLRQPYLADHLSILLYHDPLRDSARRVAQGRMQAGL